MKKGIPKPKKLNNTLKLACKNWSQYKSQLRKSHAKKRAF